MGLEFISIELDNPFGDDENDFDCVGTALAAFEDIYVCILECDGPEWTELLRQRVSHRRKGSGSEATETTALSP